MARTFRINDLIGYTIVYEQIDKGEVVKARVYGPTAKADAKAAVATWKQPPQAAQP